jgi:poly-beta-hydroxybutyrate-responsive repressor
MKELSNFGFYSIDQGNFYRTLRKLEKDALITSEWETSDEGPARRVYSITNLGEEYLNLWANSMEKTQEMLNSFMKIYSSFFKQLSINNKEDNNE